MKRLCYCPKCGRSEILTDASEFDRYKSEKTISNLRGGYGRPITHYKCICGNFLAGSMDVSEWDDDGIMYAKAVIRGYNEGGAYFEQRMLDAVKTEYINKRQILRGMI